MLVITGAEGVLGRAVTKEASRRKIPAAPLGHFELDVTNEHIVRARFEDIQRYAPGAVTLINCAGLIHSREDNLPTMHLVNAYGPLLLAHLLPPHWRMIHVSTDCVFDHEPGLTTPRRFAEHVQTRPSTPYGRSKALGEACRSDRVRVVRTSFISRDAGFWRAVREGEITEGWAQAWWSGGTVRQVAEGLLDMAGGSAAQGGFVHLATRVPITKYRLACLIADHEGVPRPAQRFSGMDRSLDSTWILEPVTAAELARA